MIRDIEKDGRECERWNYDSARDAFSYQERSTTSTKLPLAALVSSCTRFSDATVFFARLRVFLPPHTEGEFPEPHSKLSSEIAFGASNTRVSLEPDAGKHAVVAGR
jgi:hypothetical protein